MIIKRLTIFTLSALFVVLPGTNSFAHATLKSSNPADGSTVEAMPSQISLTFNEELMNLDGEQVNTIALLDGNSEDVSLSEITVDNATIAAKVNVNTYVLPGDYRIKYRVVSADGHPIEGEVLFTYAAAETSESTSDAVVVPTSDEGINTELIGGFLALIMLIALLLWLRKRK
jgi:methionine-rich copper-binding protein CopC